jgi:hypothetical protein
VGSAASATFRFSAEVDPPRNPRLQATAVTKITGFDIDIFIIFPPFEDVLSILEGAFALAQGFHGEFFDLLVE